MRKISIILLLLASSAFATEQTPNQIKTSAASTFTANGVGAITGPNVGTAITNIADSFIPTLYVTADCFWKSNGLALSASCGNVPVANVVNGAIPILDAENTWTKPQRIGGGSPLSFNTNAPNLTGSTYFIPSATDTVGAAAVAIERSTTYSGGTTTSPALFVGTKAAISAPTAWVDGTDSEVEVTSYSGGGGGFAEAVRGRCTSLVGVNGMKCTGGVFVARAESTTGQNLALGVESETDNYWADAPQPFNFNRDNFYAGFLASAGLGPADTNKIADAAYLVNPYSAGGFQAGYECPEEFSAGTMIRWSCFFAANTAPYGLDLFYGTWTSAAIRTPGFSVDGVGLITGNGASLTGFSNTWSSGGTCGLTIGPQFNGVWGVVQPICAFRAPEVQLYSNAATGRGTGAGFVITASEGSFTGLPTGVPHFYFVPDGGEFTSAYTIQTVTDSTHVTLTVAPPAATGSWYFVADISTSMSNCAGATCDWVSGETYIPFLPSKAIIGGTVYDVTAATTTQLTLNPPPGTQTGVAVNQYFNDYDLLAVVKTQGVFGGNEENLNFASRATGTHEIYSSFAGSGKDRPIIIRSGNSGAPFFASFIQIDAHATGDLSLGGTYTTDSVRVQGNNQQAATNFLFIPTALTGQDVTLTAGQNTGDAAVGMNLTTTGVGTVKVNGSPVVDLGSAQTITGVKTMSPKLPTYTIAALLAITCNAGARGTLAWVTDTVGAVAPIWNAAVVGGGAAAVDNEAACNGAAWVYQ